MIGIIDNGILAVLIALVGTCCHFLQLECSGQIFVIGFSTVAVIDV